MPESGLSARPLPRDGTASPPRTVSVFPLGCRANQEEMECLLSRLGEAGYGVVPFGEAADWIIVNTCTVTSAADSDSRQAIRRAARVMGAGREGGFGKLVVTGCLAQRDPRSLAAIPGVDWVVGNAEKVSLARWILDDEGSHPAAPGSGEPGSRPGARILVGADPTLAGFADYGVAREGRRTRATLKIQDGCSEHCTFCVIPRVRGRSRSRPLDGILRQAEMLAASGYRELVLTGINTALWGRDLAGEPALPDLLAALAEVPGLARVRLNSLEPQYVSESWLDAFAANAKLCRHFHLPLQSGDDGILRRMNRRITARGYAAVVAGIRARMPEAAVGCDVMVGFPGEGPAEAAATRRFLDEVSPAYLHVFSYSPRPGTAAPLLGSEVPVGEKKIRSARLRLLDGDLRRRFARRQEGSVQQVLPEAPSGAGHWQGLTGNYLRVRFPWTGTGAAAPGLRSVRLGERDADGTVRGSLLES